MEFQQKHYQPYLDGVCCRTVCSSLHCYEVQYRYPALPWKLCFVMHDRYNMVPADTCHVRPTGLIRHVHLGYVDPHVLPPVRKLLPHRLQLLACGAPGCVAVGVWNFTGEASGKKLHNHVHEGVDKHSAPALNVLMTWLAACVLYEPEHWLAYNSGKLVNSWLKIAVSIATHFNNLSGLNDNRRDNNHTTQSD